jgi:hypothetical protein
MEEELGWLSKSEDSENISDWMFCQTVCEFTQLTCNIPLGNTHSRASVSGYGNKYPDFSIIPACVHNCEDKEVI